MRLVFLFKEIPFTIKEEKTLRDRSEELRKLYLEAGKQGKAAVPVLVEFLNSSSKNSSENKKGRGEDQEESKNSDGKALHKVVHFESLDIMEYLEKEFSDQHPLSSKEFRRWGKWSVDSLREAINMYKYGRGGTSEEGAEQVAVCFSVIDQQLQNSKFLTGDAIALADFAVWPFVRQAMRVQPVLISLPPNVLRWFKSIQEHPRLSRVMEKNLFPH